MKYLKKIFENEYYQEISGFDPLGELSDDEPLLYIPFEEKYSKKLIHLGFTLAPINKRCCSIYANNMHVNVFQRPDEYFDVAFTWGTPLMGRERKYYRCDQFDGLLKLLKDKKII
jgi:hypothetical protein